VPLCSFVRSWIERHEGYEDLVDHDLVAQLRP
jgi:predicted GNAT family acetyltransferase